jgi:hypothetical protein
MLLGDPGEEAGHVDEGQDRDVEGVAEAHEARAFFELAMSSTPASTIGWLATTPTVRPSIRPEAEDDVGGVRRLELEEVALVGDLPDQLVHVVGLAALGGISVSRLSSMRSHGSSLGRFGRSWRFDKRQEIEELARREQRLDVILEGDVGDAPTWSVWVTAPPSSSCGHHLVGDRLHHLGSGDEHVGASFTMKMKSVIAGEVDRAARARAHDQADLRDHAAGEHVALEHLGIAARLATPSWMRAPPLSLRPMTGAPTFIAMSMTLQIFCAWRSDSEPPNTVKSCAKT